MGLDLELSIPAITVFLQGLFSFLSPCILPIIPLYLGYLSGGAKHVGEDGVVKYNQKTVIINTIFFIVGISFAFFILGFGFSQVGQFFTDNQMLFSRIGGMLIIFFGLVQLGWLDKPLKGREFRLPLQINVLKMNPFMALLLGFTFSFAWTPCVGPALSTVLIMISSAQSTDIGIMLMGIYTIGFTLPFLIVGIFTTQVLNAFKKYQKVINYTVKIGGVLMILVGVMMFTGTMNTFTNYLGVYEPENVTTPSEPDDANDNAAEESTVIPAIDFELTDQFGTVHKLSDYKGKVVFLNFWATWCPPCKKEMPDVQKLYEAYGENTEDVIVLGVVSPYSEQNKYTKEQDSEGVIKFLEESDYTYPTVLDTSGMLSREYGINAYPTTFMIDKEGNVFGYVPGLITYDIMENIIMQTLNEN